MHCEPLATEFPHCDHVSTILVCCLLQGFIRCGRIKERLDERAALRLVQRQHFALVNDGFGRLLNGRHDEVGNGLPLVRRSTFDQ